MLAFLVLVVCGRSSGHCKHGSCGSAVALTGKQWGMGARKKSIVGQGHESMGNLRNGRRKDVCLVHYKRQEELKATRKESVEMGWPWCWCDGRGRDSGADAAYSLHENLVLAEGGLCIASYGHLTHHEWFLKPCLISSRSEHPSPINSSQNTLHQKLHIRTQS